MAISRQSVDALAAEIAFRYTSIAAANCLVVVAAVSAADSAHRFLPIATAPRGCGLAAIIAVPLTAVRAVRGESFRRVKAAQSEIVELDRSLRGRLTRCQLGDTPATKLSLLDYFFINSNTALVIPTMPTRIVGSGTGANLLECALGNGVPVFLLSAIFAGSTAPM